MLVLSRKTQEQIRIGDNITISVLKIKGNSIQIGIEAPREVSILRGELPAFKLDDRCEAGHDSETTECAPAAEDEPAVVEQAGASLQSYLRLRRRRRQVLEAAAG